MEYLHPKSTELIKKLEKRGGRTSARDLEDEGMDHASVIRSAMWCQEKDLVEIKSEEEISYKLSQKGEDEYIRGLPEKRLVQEITPQEKEEIDKIKDKVEDIDVAIGEAKKKGWIDIESEGDKKYIKITDKGEEESFEETDIENALDKLKSGLSISDKNLIEEMVDRGLVDEINKVNKAIVLTEKGKEAAENVDELEVVSQLKPEIIKDGLWKELQIRRYDVNAPVNVIRPGKKQPYKAYLDHVRNELLKRGFKEVKTPLVEQEFWNFDVLFQAQDHPAREIHDKFELEFPTHGELENSGLIEKVKKTHKDGWDLDSLGWGYEWSKEQASRLMLRSQTTASSVRMLAKDLGSPSKIFTIDRNFRPDVIDSQHFVEFYQMEGIVKEEDLNLRDLLGYLKEFGKEIAGAKKIRLRPGYFPFTEPSVELDAYREDLGWIELGGAGLFRPEVLAPLGVDDPVIAWGMGIGRFAMLKLDRTDLRNLAFPRDLKELKESPMSMRKAKKNNK